MGKWTEKVEELVHHGRIKVPYTWSVGEVGSRFFIELRDRFYIVPLDPPITAKARRSTCR